MTDGSKAPDLWELIRQRVFRRFGIPGLVGIAILSAFFYVFTHWKEVKTWPGVEFVVSYLTRRSVPKADPNRFSILVAHLENDNANNEHENLIIEGLNEFHGIQVLSLDRTIRLKGPIPEEMEKQGHGEARGYLERSGASVLIWGKVLPLSGKTALKLYWTPAQENWQKWNRYDAPRLENQLGLPELFWIDLAEILRLLVVASDGEFRTKEGHYVTRELPPFIARVRTLLEESTGRPGWNADARNATLAILADTLQVLGDQSGKNEPLEEAVAIWSKVLKERARDRAPHELATAQNNLGLALKTLGERESGISLLEEAVASFKEALKERTREKAPLDWAATQNNLGSAFQRIGERESGTKRLMEAVAAHREALKERTQLRVPLYWAQSQNNLGIALGCLGDREEGTAHLEEAVVAFREAMKEYTRERVPVKWAIAQNNLGNTLVLIGKRGTGTHHLKEAVAAFNEALKERTRDRAPLDWAMTKNNMGVALRYIGEREGSTTRLEEAITTYKAALEVYEERRATYYINMTKNNLIETKNILQQLRDSKKQ